MSTFTLDCDERHAVGEVLLAYATGIDRRDWNLVASCFTDVCDVDYGDLGHFVTAEAFAAFMADIHEPFGPTMHRITNVSLTPTGNGVTSRCYVHAIVVPQPGASAAHVFAWYDDELVLSDGRWQIARRQLTRVATEMHEPSA